MTTIEKLIERLKGKPKDLTFNEAIRILNSLGYNEIRAGKTAGSRAKFENAENKKFTIHKPHPSNIVAEADVDRLISLCEEEGINNETK